MIDSTETGGGIDGVQPPHTLAERALVLVPVLRKRIRESGGRKGRDAEARVAEAVGLAKAIDLEIVDAMIVGLAEIRPSTLFGSGKVKEIASLVMETKIGLVVVDHALSPVQQRNLEKAFAAKVIDRTGLILEIFGARAQTREGTLQVELAHLNYQKSRLVRSWTHLERQRGGYGFLGGPGETQIEADRRMIGDRVIKIERELATVATRRRLQRENRRRSAIPTVALVGYTNAGKSTLFNALSNAEIFADDKLFATLDPTLRRVELPQGTSIILSDTVGFVADLPTMLVAAFRATLEEVSEADLILHVRDIAQADSEAEAREVEAVLGELGVDAQSPDRIIEVWNKIDLIAEDNRPRPVRSDISPQIIPVSALTGEGLDDLLSAIEVHISSNRSVFNVELVGEGLAQLHKLYDLGEVLDRTDSPDGSTKIRLRVPEEYISRFCKTFPGAYKEH